MFKNREKRYKEFIKLVKAKNEAGATKLLRKMPDPNFYPEGQDLLFAVVVRSRILALLKPILTHPGFDPTVLSRKNYTIMDLALLSGSAVVVQLTIENGVDPNKTSGRHPPAVVLVKVCGNLRHHPGLLKKYVELGGRIDLPDGRGYLPIHHAASLGAGAWLKDLVDLGRIRMSRPGAGFRHCTWRGSATTLRRSGSFCPTVVPRPLRPTGTATS